MEDIVHKRGACPKSPVEWSGNAGIQWMERDLLGHKDIEHRNAYHQPQYLKGEHLFPLNGKRHQENLRKKANLCAKPLRSPATNRGGNSGSGSTHRARCRQRR
ncbi:hypothetical protein E2320_003778 [Naja naja]|nr:hypothetical protein E2320_003778 [Naja naja]